MHAFIAMIFFKCQQPWVVVYHSEKPETKLSFPAFSSSMPAGRQACVGLLARRAAEVAALLCNSKSCWVQIDILL